MSFPPIIRPSVSRGRVGRDDADDAAFVQDGDAGAEGEHFVQFRGDEHDRAAVRLPLAQAGMDIGRRRDIQAARGADGDEQRGLAPQGAGDDDLLLVAAGQRPGGQVQDVGADVEVARGLGGKAAQSAAVQKRAAPEPGQPGGFQRQVVGDAEREGQTFAVAVRRDKGDAVPFQVAGRRRVTRVAADRAPCPAVQGRRPVSAWASSACPLPSTPAKPNISPGRTSKLRSRRGMASGAAAVLRRETERKGRPSPPAPLPQAGEGGRRSITHAAVELGDGLHQRQSQTHPRRAARALATEEALGRAGAVRLGNPGAAVGDGDAHHARLADGGELDRAARRRELHRVVEQVRDRLLDQLAVAVGRQADPARDSSSRSPRSSAAAA